MINRSFRSLFGKLVIGGALGLASVAASSQLALGEELSTPASVPSPTADHPTRGMTMEKVQAKFGAPTKRDDAVGQPPITRWEYPGFVVYFEHQYVLHTVVAG